MKRDRNELAASTTSGSVTLQGAGIGHLNGAPLVLRDTTVAGNVATGKGPGGMAQGGGIWNGSLDPSSSLGPLRLIDSTVARNMLEVSAGITAQGGGIFTIAKPSIGHTTIAHNRPDQPRMLTRVPPAKEADPDRTAGDCIGDTGLGSKRTLSQGPIDLHAGTRPAQLAGNATPRRAWPSRWRRDKEGTRTAVRTVIVSPGHK